MIRKKDIQQINDKLDNFTSSIVRKANNYDKIMESLKSVIINVERAYATFDETSMRYVVKIDYSVPQSILYIGDDGEAELNTRFKAMNDLDLIPIDDLSRVVSAMLKANEENKN